MISLIDGADENESCLLHSSWATKNDSDVTIILPNNLMRWKNEELKNKKTMKI